MWRLGIFNKIIASFLFVAFASLASGQEAGGGKVEEAFEARQVVGGILVSGLVGGILGLSTLSFYSEPQDHIRNITIGAGVSMIVAVIFLTSNAANVPIEVDDKKTAMLYPMIDEHSVRLGALLRF